GLLHCREGLLAHAALDSVRRFGLQAASIDEKEAVVFPLGGLHEAVPRGARLVRGDSESLANDAIEEGGLADVRPAHYCDNGLAIRPALRRATPCRRFRLGAPFVREAGSRLRQRRGTTDDQACQPRLPGRGARAAGAER